jgi:hypothetical protein
VPYKVTEFTVEEPNIVVDQNGCGEMEGPWKEKLPPMQEPAGQGFRSIATARPLR